jgi:D-alanyl-D-alanine carboxypeptidase
MTLGVMLGMPTVTGGDIGPMYPPVPPVAGIMSAAELDAYLAVHNVEARNGRLADGEVMAVSGGWTGSARLLPPAGAAWEEMRAAAAIDGVDVKVIDSYRTWESQARAYEAHLRGEKKANVLPPGRSEHGNGLAVDVTNGAIIGRDDAEWAWLQANASRFGRYPISNETWHWELRGTS